MSDKDYYELSIAKDREVVWQSLYEYIAKNSFPHKKKPSNYYNMRRWYLSICSKLNEMQSELLCHK